MENWTLGDEFLSDLAELQELFSLPSDAAEPGQDQSARVVAPARSQPSNRARAHRKRPPHRVAVQALKREIETLDKQLRRLRQTKEPQKLRACGSRVSWRQQAVSSRIAQQDAQEETRTLKRRLAESARLVDRVTQVLTKHLNTSPGPLEVQRVLLDDEARVLTALKADLDARYGQLDALIDISRIETLAMRKLSSRSIRKMDLWTPFVQQQGAGVSFEETEMLPFNIKMIQKVAAGCVSLNAIMGPSNLVSDQIRRDRKPRDLSLSAAAIDKASGGTEMHGRMILRVIVKDPEILFMWEHAFYWLANEDSQSLDQHVLVRDSGFAVVMPCLHFDATIVHLSKSISMNAMDGSVLRPRDPRVRRIAGSCRSWFDAHIRSVENKLMA